MRLKILTGMMFVLLLAGCGVNELRGDIQELRSYQADHQRASQQADLKQSHRAASERLDRHTE